MLTRNSKLVVPPECSFVTWLHPEFRDWSERDSDSSRVENFVQRLMEARKFHTWDLRPNEVRQAIRQWRPSSYSALASTIYGTYARTTGKPTARWGDKNNVYLSEFRALLQLFPSAQIVWLVRDVRDIFCSALETQLLDKSLVYRPRLSEDPEVLGLDWSSQNRALLNYSAHAPQGQTIRIRYEDLVRYPDQILRELCQFLNVRFEPAMLTNHPGENSFSTEPEELLPWKLRTLEPVTAERVSRYKLELGGEQLQLLENHCRGLLLSFGYEIDARA